MGNINSYSKPIRTTGFWKKVDAESGKIKVFALSGEFEFDSVAGKIWLLCDGSRTVREITEVIHEEYPQVELKVIEADIAQFLLAMERDDLVILDYDPLFPHKKLHYIEKIAQI